MLCGEAVEHQPLVEVEEELSVHLQGVVQSVEKWEIQQMTVADQGKEPPPQPACRVWRLASVLQILPASRSRLEDQFWSCTLIPGARTVTGCMLEEVVVPLQVQEGGHQIVAEEVQVVPLELAPAGTDWRQTKHTGSLVGQIQREAECLQARRYCWQTVPG